MKLLRVERARAIWLGDIKEFNPRGIAIAPPFVAGMLERYKFKEYPNLSQVPQPDKGSSFKYGIFEVPKGEPIEINLEVFWDGLIADTISTTDDTDSFLTDMLDWVSNTFKVPRYQEIIKRKVYLSEIYFETNKKLTALNPRLEEYSKLISSKIKGYGQSLSIEPIQISYGINEGLERKPVYFRIERALGVDFAENKYFSIGPFETDVHLQLVEEFEKMLST